MNFNTSPFEVSGAHQRLAAEPGHTGHVTVGNDVHAVVVESGDVIKVVPRQGNPLFRVRQRLLQTKK